MHFRSTTKMDNFLQIFADLAATEPCDIDEKSDFKNTLQSIISKFLLITNVIVPQLQNYLDKNQNINITLVDDMLCIYAQSAANIFRNMAIQLLHKRDNCLQCDHTKPYDKSDQKCADHNHEIGHFRHYGTDYQMSGHKHEIGHLETVKQFVYIILRIVSAI